MSRYVTLCLLVALAVAMFSAALAQEQNQVQELIAQLKDSDESVRLKARNWGR
jgi:hypothetical protein